MTYFYVYILQSELDQNRYYVGFTTDLKARLEQHNNKESEYTSTYAPWHLTTAIAFTDEKKARLFEKYLKSGSGRAFSKKHF